MHSPRPYRVIVRWGTSGYWGTSGDETLDVDAYTAQDAATQAEIAVRDQTSHKAGEPPHTVRVVSVQPNPPAPRIGKSPTASARELLQAIARRCSCGAGEAEIHREDCRTLTERIVAVDGVGATVPAQCICPSLSMGPGDNTRITAVRCPVHGACTCRTPATQGLHVAIDPRCPVHGGEIPY